MSDVVGYETGWDPDPGPSYEPDSIDLARMRFLDLFPYDEHNFDPDSGHFTDTDIDRLASGWDPERSDAPSQWLRAVLFLRRWRRTRRDLERSLLLHLLRHLLRQLMARQHDRAAAQHVRAAADHRSVTDLSPPVSLLHARAVLTAAPPARVPIRAGTAG